MVSHSTRGLINNCPIRRVSTLALRLNQRIVEGTVEAFLVIILCLSCVGRVCQSVFR
jgi:hypothetical protein